MMKAIVYPEIEQLILDLTNEGTAANALSELSSSLAVCNAVPNLAPLLWYSPCVITSLIQKIVNVYIYVKNPNISFTISQAERLCQVLSLFECIASHPETRNEFLNALLAEYIYPFLKQMSDIRSFQLIRFASLSVIVALIDSCSDLAVPFLIGSGFIPLLLKILQYDTNTSQLIALNIFYKILLNDKGLSFICDSYERFSHVAIILGKLVTIATEFNKSQLKLIISCYSRLADNERANLSLSKSIPEQLKDPMLYVRLHQEDENTMQSLYKLLKKLRIP